MNNRRYTLALSPVLCLVTLLLGTPAQAASTKYKSVCADGPPYCDYSSVQTAIDSITDSSAANVYTVFIDSGVLSTDTSITTNGKSYINFVGRGIGASVIRASANWYINNQPAFDSVDLFNLSNSTNITLRALTIDARTGDPCLVGGGCFGPNTFYAGVRTDQANRILVQDAEIMGITYGLYEVVNTTGNLIQVFNSKILASNYAIGTRSATWHIFSSDIRAVTNGDSSGSVSVTYAINAGNSTTLENVAIWGSHLHAESGKPGQTYNVAAVSAPFKEGSRLAIVGSTLHVKMTTTDIGSATRVMAALFPNAACGMATPLSTINVMGSDFLYESPTGLLQGRLSGIGWTGSRCVSVNVLGGGFIDNGGSGGTYRADIVGQPSVLGSYEPIINTYGTRLNTIQNTSATPLLLATGALSNTSNTQSGKVTFPGSNTVTVTLPRPMLDTTYRVIATANLSETLYVSAKTTTSFTLKSSKAGSTAIADWILMR